MTGTRAGAAWAAAAVLLAAGKAMAAPAPVIDNDRVVVWNLTLSRGQPASAARSDLDEVVIFPGGGQFRATEPKGSPRLVRYRPGAAIFVPRGTERPGALLSISRAQVVVVALKDRTSPPVAPVEGLPPAFPRAGAVKVLENDRVVAWNYSWRPGVTTPMHHHDKDAVLVFRFDGALESIARDGTSIVTAHKAGEILFNPANRVHSERLVAARQSAIIVELK
jgi:quercetin dioxygenase-like cupin family protein